MKNGYEDILALAARAREEPQWWDENGAPRFTAYHPRHCPNLLADEVALVLIACQECKREMHVEMSVGLADRLQALAREGKVEPLAQQICEGAIHYGYGDPPHHTDAAGASCRLGCTMGCLELRVVEFWKRSNARWARCPELEIALG